MSRGPARALVGILAALAVLAAPGCRKVPITDVGAYFSLSDATWFEAEQTLFVFYEVRAEQGLGENSVVEITYETDEVEVPWTPLENLPQVHAHVPVDCGPDALCGSASLWVPLEPRALRVRMRYHRDGALALDTQTTYNVVPTGPPHTSRSLVVYGVFDETNRRIQWRGRHRFPTLRNHDVEALGLRREIVVEDPRYGTASLATGDNPYGYGVVCPPTFEPAGLEPLATADRARFHPDELPLEASDASTVCALATVTDGTGTFTTGAIARKNPEVRPAFPVLRSPVRDALPLRFFLGPCERTISAPHEDMQRQRLLLGDVPTTCTDDWRRPGFVGELVAEFRDAIEAARPVGQDMVLAIALHQDEPELQELLEEALAEVVPPERFRSSPRVAGAFVFDSDTHAVGLRDLRPVTLWCPASPYGAGPSNEACALAPEDDELVLGPLSFDDLPILPTRDDYLEFVETYSEDQAGRVESLSFRTPEFATTTEHLPVDPFGVVTFLNGEQIGADADDAFSYCLGDAPTLFVFRTPLVDQLDFEDFEEDCAEELPPELCASAGAGVLPIAWLPAWHEAFREESYALGILWEFPFLLRMQYEVVQAGSVSAFGLSVPFGFAGDAESYYGAELWLQEAFPLADQLTQCTRFCDHPTFDSAGVYHVTDPFRTTYAQACYLPRYPAPGDGGFPLDP